MPNQIQMTRSLFAILFLSVSAALVAQDKPAYQLYTADGKPVTFDKMMQTLTKADVVLFGELHDNSIDHWLELQTLKELHAQRKDLMLGLEMFEADDQIVLDEYLQGLIEERHLLSEAKVWDNYKNDYKPLIDYAKAEKLPTIATNVPRRYASVVFKKGIDALNALPAQAKQWIAPLPIEVDLSLPCYKDMMDMSDHSAGAGMSGENMAKSQAVKDATMAYFILKNRKGIFLHFHGAYHSQKYEGMTWYLKKADPKLKIVTVHSAEQASIDKLEDANKGMADFVICIPQDMTKTY